MHIVFNFQTPANVTNRTGLKNFIDQIFKEEDTPLASLSFVFCDDVFLLDINRRFLDHNYFTDIITFNYAGSDEPVNGEIYISVDTVLKNARTFNKTFRNELHRVIFHGVLHLCGYADKTEGEQSIMRSKEDNYLLKYFG